MIYILDMHHIASKIAKRYKLQSKHEETEYNIPRTLKVY